MTTKLQLAIRAYRWNSQVEASVFAAEIGITTREYNRYEQGLSIDTESLRKIIAWAFRPCEPPKQVTLAELEAAPDAEK